MFLNMQKCVAVELGLSKGAGGTLIDALELLKAYLPEEIAKGVLDPRAAVTMQSRFHLTSYGWHSTRVKNAKNSVKSRGFCHPAKATKSSSSVCDGRHAAPTNGKTT